MKPIILAAALALGLAGCATLDNVLERDPVKEVIVGCNTITSSLNVLAPNIDRLSDAQVDAVDRVRHLSDPICSTEDTPATAADLITELAAQIVAVQSSIVEGS